VINVLEVLTVSIFRVIKIKQSHYMPWRHLREDEVKLLLIIDLCTRWGSMVGITPWPHFSLGERTPSTQGMGSSGGPRASVDSEARGRILCLCWGSKSDHPVGQSIVRNCTDCIIRVIRVFYHPNDCGSKHL
jgi:hypothetical protein